MEYSDLVYACAMNRIFNYDCRLARKMMETYPEPGTLFRMSEVELREIFGVRSPYPARFSDRRILDDACREVDWAGKKNLRVIWYRDPDYPSRLKECTDAPLLLFVAGNADMNPGRVVSIVGTRRSTPYGESMCRQIVRELSALEPGPTIVSGLAYGVDICAHREAMSAGLQTVGVMATGINEIYPSAHRADAAAMCTCGGILTDFWRGAPPNKYNFLRRNRIIAGLCDAVILVESDIRGGGVVTSRMAFSYSREVFALPGRTSDIRSAGCNALIAEKVAEMITSPGHITRVMGWMKGRKTGAVGENPELFGPESEVKRNIVVALSQNPGMDADAVGRMLSIDCQTVMVLLTELEMDGHICRDDGGAYRII